MNRNHTFSALTWIIISTLLIIPLLSNSPATAAAPKSEFPLNLLFSKSDIPKIIENTKHPLFKEYWQSLLDADVNKDHNFLRVAFIITTSVPLKTDENLPDISVQTRARRLDC